MATFRLPPRFGLGQLAPIDRSGGLHLIPEVQSSCGKLLAKVRTCSTKPPAFQLKASFPGWCDRQGMTETGSWEFPNEGNQLGHGFARDHSNSFQDTESGKWMVYRVIQGVGNESDLGISNKGNQVSFQETSGKWMVFLEVISHSLHLSHQVSDWTRDAGRAATATAQHTAASSAAASSLGGTPFRTERSVTNRHGTFTITYNHILRASHISSPFRPFSKGTGGTPAWSALPRRTWPVLSPGHRLGLKSAGLKPGWIGAQGMTPTQTIQLVGVPLRKGNPQVQLLL